MVDFVPRSNYELISQYISVFPMQYGHLQLQVHHMYNTVTNISIKIKKRRTAECTVGRSCSKVTRLVVPCRAVQGRQRGRSGIYRLDYCIVFVSCSRYLIRRPVFVALAHLQPPLCLQLGQLPALE